jgi:EAL and modified HD-GYP domain-containing signal transduction protein
MAKVACLRLLSELRQQDLDYASMERIIREDVSFSYKLLRYVNSALFHFRSDIQAIDHALVVLGEQSVRHWAALAALPVLAKGKPGELITHSLVRARLCELLAENARMQEAPQAFLMGLFSLLDALIDLPLEDALNQMSLSSNIRDVILGRAREKDKFSMLYQLVRRYEEAEWDQVATLAAGLGIQDPAAVAKAYTKSVLWAYRALHATSSRDEPEHGARRAPHAAHAERQSVGP